MSTRSFESVDSISSNNILENHLSGEVSLPYQESLQVDSQVLSLDALKYAYGLTRKARDSFFNRNAKEQESELLTHWMATENYDALSTYWANRSADNVRDFLQDTDPERTRQSLYFPTMDKVGIMIDAKFRDAIPRIIEAYAGEAPVVRHFADNTVNADEIRVAEWDAPYLRVNHHLQLTEHDRQVIGAYFDFIKK